MADVIRKSTNKFTKGLIMDFSPENTQKEVLTHALNATLLTFNGNEMSLQNDMGNARVETAYLPEGYMPVGTCEYGGVIYIVSYNPLEDKSQIGCFPSPERNISRHELGEAENVQITADKFHNKTTGQIINTTQYVLLKNDKLNPGDKFMVCANNTIYDERLENLLVHKDLAENQVPSEFEPVENPVLALNVVSIEDSGKVIYLNNDIRDYTNTNTYTDEDGVRHTNGYKYHIVGSEAASGPSFNQEAMDPDAYRNMLNSGYSVFKSKTSGKLAILAELIMIDSYNVTHSLVPKKTDKGEIIEGAFDLVIHTEVTPDVTPSNYKTVPKLQYYYLKDSQGYIDNYDSEQVSTPIPMFDDSGKINKEFSGRDLSQIYVPTDNSDIHFEGTLGNTGKFNFPQPDTYHSYMQLHNDPVNGIADLSTYTKFSEGKYHRMILDQIPTDRLSYFTDKLQASFYKYKGNSENEYEPWTESTLNSAYTYYIQNITYEYTNAKRDKNMMGRDLFKLVSEPTSATEKEIKDVEIEKFQYANVFSVRVATMEDYEKGETLYEKKDDSYVQITNLPEAGKTYYILKNETVLVSIGFEVIRENHPGEIFYYPTEKSYNSASTSDLATYWDFTTYPFETAEPYGCPVMLYYRDPIITYRLATTQELLNYKNENIQLYYSADYLHIPTSELKNTFSDLPLYVVVPIDAYVSKNNFEPSFEHNYIAGCEEESEQLDATYPVGDPLSLYQVSSFIPSEPTTAEYKPYNDLILANIQIPSVCTANGLDLPFRYDYTIVPCMNYGRLDHLAISNTVDFSKLHAFNQSDFTTWRYRIDGNQLRLTFGAEVYDTYEAENEKVSGLFLEFYDVWGFAGSIEISDKKSYSGLFTKVISLNTKNALSSNKLNGNVLHSAYQRNINIKPDGTDRFVCDGKDVAFGNDYQGWNNITDNDCGTLYSNIIYTVKTYLKRSENGEVKYIPKREFFLYTLPIFNDYYYSITDFSNIKFPQLDLAMTYKIQDTSVRNPFSKDSEIESDIISNGYYKNDRELLNVYTEGSYKENSINATKYINFIGQSNVNLEIGLKQDYQELGLSYSQDINNYFSCTLELSDEDSGNTPFSVKSPSLNSELTSEKSMLSYYHNGNSDLELSINKLGFNSDYTKTIEIDPLNIYNFLYQGSGTTIPIKYSFIVGYPISLTNIRETEIQATTFCALCHKTDSGSYNYSDFGIYEQNGDFLSENMFYNGGTYDLERFGVCNMVNPNEKFMGNQCQSVDFVETPTEITKNPGKLNSGEPLKQMSKYVGKLAFGQPHAHCLSENEGVNIHGNDSAPHHAITTGESLSSSKPQDNTAGMLPWWYLYQNPRYNLSLNTQNSLNNYSEFISTLDYKTISNALLFGKGWEGGDADKKDKNKMVEKRVTAAREYTGFTAKQLSDYNKQLLQTMKEIYAYNPDYDSLKLYSGDVAVTNNKIKFISNLISKEASLKFPDGLTFNDFIYFGSMKVSDYIKYMWKYSSVSESQRVKVYSEPNKPKDQILFKASLAYCGGESPYLISNLTYDTSNPGNLESEWSLSVSNPVMLRKESGHCIVIQGTPKKKSLYGFDEATNKLVELDVSNYKINKGGFLKLNGFIKTGSSSGSVKINSDNFYALFDNPNYEFVIDTGDLKGSKARINIAWDKAAVQRLPLYNGKLYLLTAEASFSPTITLIATADILDEDDVRYSNVTVYLEGTVVGKHLKGSLMAPYGNSYGSTYQNPNLEYRIGVWDQNRINPKTGINCLETLVKDYPNYTSVSIPLWLPEDSPEPVNVTSTKCWVSGASDDHKVSINFGTNSFNMPWGNNYVINVNAGIESGLGLYEIAITKVSLYCNKNLKLAAFNEDVISSSKTSSYASIVNHKYQVDETYKEARFRGTSLTINDLLYNYNGEHRLFVNNSLIKYDDYLRNKLYYRGLAGKNNTDKYTFEYTLDAIVNPGCHARDSQDNLYQNALFLYTGPCFTDDNL